MSIPRGTGGRAPMKDLKALSYSDHPRIGWGVCKAASVATGYGCQGKVNEHELLRIWILQAIMVVR